jgi:hypothetical protein
VRRLSFFAKRLRKIQIYDGTDGKNRRIQVVDVEDLWQLLMAEYEEQFEEARREAAMVLKAADTDGNGEIDLEELAEVVSVFDEQLSRPQVGSQIRPWQTQIDKISQRIIPFPAVDANLILLFIILPAGV